MRCCIALLVALLAVQGCGQTGDLYWPEQEQEQVEIDDEQSSQREQPD